MTIYPKLSSEDLITTAKLCHEVNKVWCEIIGDKSQKSWEESPDWQKDSAIMGVAFHINNPSSKDSDSHDSWMQQKLSDGWVWGEVKDADKKEHPCLVDFEDLPTEQKVKDALFRSVVKSVLKYQGHIDDNVVGSKDRTSEDDDKTVGSNPGE